MSRPSYLTFADWVRDALTRWQFHVSTRSRPDSQRSFQELLQLAGPTPHSMLRATARLIWFALLGGGRASRVAVDGEHVLTLPRYVPWLRPTGETPLEEKTALASVLTARWAPRKGLPQLGPTPKRNQIEPTQEHDWGMDPVHTPEGNRIRQVGHLGVGARIEARRLIFSKNELPLSVSTARLPFAGWNEPRRLLMAANMQVHAAPLAHAETPRIVNGPVGLDPPGVNLRVAFLAWQGWNHEDAWVLSASAARKLQALSDSIQSIFIRALELPPRLLVQPGEHVRRGQHLLERRVAPALLAPTLEQLAALPGLSAGAVLAPEREDRACRAGLVTQIEIGDLRSRNGLPAEWVVPVDLASRYRLAVRVHLRHESPLAVGDKLANRHGHKGVVGHILPDEEMPRWRNEPLEALIDPVSVLNRSNWGQVLEGLAGATVSEDETLDATTLSAEEVLRRARRRNANAQGRCVIEPPPVGSWLTRPVKALAGVQFVMRMPQRASELLSSREQRLGEMDQWALWAHGLVSEVQDHQTRLSKSAAEWRRLLAQAGFDLRATQTGLEIRELRLDRPPPKTAYVVSRGDKTLPELFDLVKGFNPGRLNVLVIEPPLANVPRPGRKADPGALHWVALWTKGLRSSQAARESARSLTWHVAFAWCCERLTTVIMVFGARRSLTKTGFVRRSRHCCTRPIAKRSAQRQRAANAHFFESAWRGISCRNPQER